MPVWVADRRVFVDTRGTQTVKVCTAQQNRRGLYETYYRIDLPWLLPKDVAESTIAQFRSLADLNSWLVGDRRAARESKNEVGPGVAIEPAGTSGEMREYAAGETLTSRSCRLRS
jgi:hypothetical protein